MSKVVARLLFGLCGCIFATSFCAADETNSPPRRLVIVGQGPDGHPVETHEFMAGARLFARCLRDVPQLEIKVEQADGPWEEGPNLLRNTDAVVLYVAEGAKWLHGDPRRLEAFAQLAARGGGLVAIHWAIGTKPPEYIQGFQRLFGGCHGGADRKYQVLETKLTIAAPQHPIARGLQDFVVRDEFYYRLKFVTAEPTLRPILTAAIDGGQETVAWAWERPDAGRSFGFSGAHFHHNWQRSEYRRLISQAILWSLKLPIPEKDFPATIADDELRLK